MATKHKAFQITAKISLECTTKVYADTYTEAVAIAKELDVYDFVKPKGDVQDSNPIDVTFIFPDHNNAVL